MTEAAQVTGLGQDRQGVDRPDAGNGAQQQVIGTIAEQFGGPAFDGVALSDKASAFGQHHAEHADRVELRRHGQPRGSLRRLVNI